MRDQAIIEGTPKARGEVYTPPVVAHFLNRWAIRRSDDRVLDLGVGMGAFTLDAYQHLCALGARADEARKSLYGAERDADSYRRFKTYAHEATGGDLPHIQQTDFFHMELPPVQAVIGNPPYVRRNHMRTDDVRAIRERLDSIPIHTGRLSALTDLYAYFLYYADHFLVSGGRLAVVIASSWLDVGYGRALKRFLLERYHIHALIGLEGRMFDDALVKCVCLLAEKRGAGSELDAQSALHPVRFITVHQADVFEQPDDLLLTDAPDASGDPRFNTTDVPRAHLDPDQPWGTYFRADALASWVASHPAMTPLGNLVTSRIGLQTFAKDFYLFTGPQGRHLPIETEYTRPLAFSPREFQHPIIAREETCASRVLFCGVPREQLAGTRTLAYIEAGERTQVRIRGKEAVVTGYHAVPKVAAARRKPWYNLVTEITRWGTFEVLLPRRLFESYLALWNQAGVIPNEDFIGLRPRESTYLAPLLAFLNSSLGECVLRMYAQIYGGGVFNLNPGDVPRLPMLDVRKLSSQDKRRLTRAYREFCDAYPANDRGCLDGAIAQIMQLTPGQQRDIVTQLAAMRQMASGAKRVHRLGQSAQHPAGKARPRAKRLDAPSRAQRPAVDWPGHATDTASTLPTLRQALGPWADAAPWSD